MKGYAEVNVHDGLHEDKNICAGGEYGNVPIHTVTILNIFIIRYSIIKSYWMVRLLLFHVLEKDSCGGDSGGPLVISKKKGVREIYTIAGITSWGPTECGGKKDQYGIYTNVAYHNKWILDHLD